MTRVEWLIGASVAGALFLIAVVVFVRRRSSRVRVDDDSDVLAPLPSDVALLDEMISLFEDAPVALCQFDVKGRILRTNSLLQSLLGLSADVLRDSNFSSLVHVEDWEHCRLQQRDLLSRRGLFCESEVRVFEAYGRLLWTRLGLRLVRDQRKRARYFIASFIDIDDWKKAGARLRLQEETLQMVVGHTPVAIWLSEANLSRVLFVNEAFEGIYGLERERFYADPGCVLRYVQAEDRESVRKVMNDAGAQGAYDINYRVQRDDGVLHYVRHMGRGIFDSHGRLLYRINSVTDISSEMVVRDELRGANDQLREANRRWQESARLDALTGCLNRGAFFEEAEKALHLEQRYKRSSTLVFFDLNNFKDVNDNFGHHVGDRALIAFVGQIRARLRTTDELGRYGGDEFVALLRETDALQARLLLATLTPVVVDAENGNSVILRFSAGVACSDDPAIETVDDWTRIADSQMYYQRTRRNGR